MPRAVPFLAAAALAAGLGAGALWLGRPGPEEAGPAHAVPGLDPMTRVAAVGEAWRLVPALLLGVYDAFGRSGEAEVYDALAQVAAGPALERLYLDRAGALAGGGLAGSDQVLHEMALTALETRAESNRLSVEAAWTVIGTVGHGTHSHVRGNAYRAALVVEPVAGAWRITGFTLRDVDRTLAGTPAPQAEAAPSAEPASSPAPAAAGAGTW
jgi:hypothetical protein